jgi:cytochrome c oxidase subunit 4
MSHVHMVRGSKPHLHSVWLYWGVFFALVFLTVVTVYLARFDFGKLSVLVTLGIAGTKSLLVLGIFMHLAYDNKFFGLIIAASLVFLSLFFIFPIADLGSRKDTDSAQQNFLPRNEKVLEHWQTNPKDLPLRPGLQPADEKKLIFQAPGEH